MQRMDRKEFLIKGCRWVAGAGALFLAGNLISCSDSGNGDTTTSSSTYGSGQSGDPNTNDSGTSSGNGSTGNEQNSGSVSVAVVVSGRCIGCGRCARGICPKDTISMIGDLAVIGAACDGCGRCVSICPRDAIHLSSGVSSSQGHYSAASAAPANTVAA